MAVPKKTRKTVSKKTVKEKEPRTFRDVVNKAQVDRRYSAHLKRVAAKARTGNPKAMEEFTTAFKLTPRALSELSPRGRGAAVFATTIPCTIVIATTFLSCFPRTSYGYHWFCTEVH